MATTVPSADVDQSEPSKAPSEPLLRRKRRRLPMGAWYSLAALGFAVLVVLVQLAFYTHRREPRDSRVIVERELRMNTLEPGERVVRSVRVFRRASEDYFRQTRGLLVLTDRRLIYLGAAPRDFTGASDVPPTFDQRVFRIDTLTSVGSTFTLLGFARALEIESPDAELKLGIPSGQWQRAQLLRIAWAGRQQKLEGIGAWAKKVRASRAHLGAILEDYRRQPVYHVVRPGDAISSIASWYETSEDKIRELNGIQGNTIKVGQRLLIRAGAPKQKG
jgi:LysM domain-containing protein